MAVCLRLPSNELTADLFAPVGGSSSASVNLLTAVAEIRSVCVGVHFVLSLSLSVSDSLLASIAVISVIHVLN